MAARSGIVPPVVFFPAPGPGFRGRLYLDPVAVVRADRLDEVAAALDKVEQYVHEGYTAAGFVSYEAGAAFEPAMPMRRLDNMPYLWFGMFEDVDDDRTVELGGASCLDTLAPTLNEEVYRRAVQRVRDYIAAGDTYQVNFTFPMHGTFSVDAFELFSDLSAAHATANYKAFVDTGDAKILSVSPELFFSLEGNRLVTKPMKGTSARGLSDEADAAARQALLDSPKERAENLMIVDLLRNDMGRISRTGSVRVRKLFEAERYERVWQLTSTIESETEAGVPDIFAALFPSGSVTGAPKIRTMQIIQELEETPRGPYCGAIGWWRPGRRAQFNVGIRTMVLDASGRATYPVGSGITWDADAQREYAECRLKAENLFAGGSRDALIETIRLDGGEYALLQRHMSRLRRSAAFFGREVPEAEIREALRTLALRVDPGAHRVRVDVHASGRYEIDVQPLDRARCFRLRWAPEPVDPAQRLLYHKTSDRSLYEAARASAAPADDVLLWNGRGEATESSIANLVVERGGRRLTPSVSSGLLPGVFREALIERGDIEEAVLQRRDVETADRIWLINSLRGWIPAYLVLDDGQSAETASAGAVAVTS